MRGGRILVRGFGRARRTSRCAWCSVSATLCPSPPPQGTGVPVGLSSPEDGTVPPAHRLMPLLRDTTSSSADVQSAQMSLLELNVRVRSYLG